MSDVSWIFKGLAISSYEPKELDMIYYDRKISIKILSAFFPLSQLLYIACYLYPK